MEAYSLFEHLHLEMTSWSGFGGDRDEHITVLEGIGYKVWSLEDLTSFLNFTLRSVLPYVKGYAKINRDSKKNSILSNLFVKSFG